MKKGVVGQENPQTLVSKGYEAIGLLPQQGEGPLRVRSERTSGKRRPQLNEQKNCTRARGSAQPLQCPPHFCGPWRERDVRLQFPARP